MQKKMSSFGCSMLTDEAQALEREPRGRKQTTLLPREEAQCLHIDPGRQSSSCLAHRWCFDSGTVGRKLSQGSAESPWKVQGHHRGCGTQMVPFAL